jgi:hypothetical protein
VLRFESAAMPGVWVTIRRMSLGRRIELAKSVRELGAKLEFEAAGTDLSSKIEAAVLAAEIDAVYLRWGLVAVTEFEIDGNAPSCDEIISAAPEHLVREILERIKRECGLSDEDRKN